MKNYSLIIALFCCYFAFSQSNDSLIIKFRSVEIPNKRFLTLQHSMDYIKDIVRPTQSNHYSMIQNSFVACDSIDIEVNKKNRIIACSFFYDSLISFEECTNSFNETFKAIGKTIHYQTDSITIKVTQWKDSLSLFEIVEVKTTNLHRVYSVLFDLEFYSRKFGKHSSVNLNAISFEVVRLLGLFGK